jgi:acetolactate synthase-1/2/3 large subunit
VLGDVEFTATTMTDWLEQADIEATGFASDELARQLEDPAPRHESATPAPGTLDLHAALDLIDRTFDQNRLLVTDGGRHIFETLKTIHVSHPNDFVHTLNFGSIGLGMGNAVGAAFGAPDRPVLFVCGDGGFMLGGLVEFNTAVRHGRDVVVIVLNDGSYGAEYIQLLRRGSDPSISLFEWPSLADVATALGGRGYDVRSLDQLADALHAIERRDGPALIDVHLDPTAIPMSGH